MLLFSNIWCFFFILFFLVFLCLIHSKTPNWHVSGNVFSLPHVRCFECILAFWYLISSKTQNTRFFFFCNSVIFLHKGCSICMLSFCYVSWKPLKRNVLINTVFFSHIRCFAYTLATSYLRSLKTLKMHVFDHVVLFSHGNLLGFHCF